MRWYEKWALFLIAAVAFLIPIEHKYDKPLRHFSYACVPEGLLLPPGFDLKIYFYPSDIIALVLFILLLFAYKISFRQLALNKGMVFLSILFSFAILSILSSPFLYYPTVYTRLLQLLTPILITAYLLHTPSSERRVHLLFSCLIAAAVLQSFIAINQYFSQEYLGLRLLSESREPPATFMIGSGRRWLLDYFSNYPIGERLLKRSAGTFPHCNAFGGFLTMTILASYSYLARAKTWWLKYWLVALLSLQFFGLATTYSRSAIFGLILGTCVWVVWALWKKQPLRFLLSAIGIATVLSFGLLTEQYLARGGILNYNAVSKNSDQIRLAAQETAVRIIHDHPVTGVGFQQFSRAAENYGNPTGAHNIYLFLCSEMGLVACLSLTGLLLFTFIAAMQIPFTPHITSLFASFMAFLFIGVCDFYPIVFQQGKLMFFLCIGLLLSESLRIQNEKTLGKPCPN